MSHIVHLGDCRSILATFAADSIDACLTDPPYELGFMGKAWDRSGIAFSVEMWREVLRVLKPGAHLLAFGGTRTSHRMTCAIEDAGFEIRDSIHWLYGTGFPKSLNLGEGRGTALKPAHEPIVLARKPLVGTVAATVEEWGTGALAIDACRVAAPDGVPLFDQRGESAAVAFGDGLYGSNRTGETSHSGRWPPNLVLSHSLECSDECSDDCAVAELDRQSIGTRASKPSKSGNRGEVEQGVALGRFSRNGEACIFYQDSGTASRFFPCFRYAAKPSRRERDAGLGHLAPATGGAATDRTDDSAGLRSPRAGAGRNGGARNIHPTVKPIELLRWLVRLITPPGGIVLDPFAGSGSTGCAAALERLRFIGCELSPEYAAIAEARMAHWAAQAKENAAAVEAEQTALPLEVA